MAPFKSSTSLEYKSIAQKILTAELQSFTEWGLLKKITHQPCLHRQVTCTTKIWWRWAKCWISFCSREYPKLLCLVSLIYLCKTKLSLTRLRCNLQSKAPSILNGPLKIVLVQEISSKCKFRKWLLTPDVTYHNCMNYSVSLASSLVIQVRILLEQTLQTLAFQAACPRCIELVHLTWLLLCWKQILSRDLISAFSQRIK